MTTESHLRRSSPREKSAGTADHTAGADVKGATTAGRKHTNAARATTPHPEEHDGNARAEVLDSDPASVGSVGSDGNRGAGLQPPAANAGVNSPKRSKKAALVGRSNDRKVDKLPSRPNFCDCGRGDRRCCLVAGAPLGDGAIGGDGCDGRNSMTNVDAEWSPTQSSGDDRGVAMDTKRERSTPVSPTSRPIDARRLAGVKRRFQADFANSDKSALQDGPSVNSQSAGECEAGGEVCGWERQRKRGQREQVTGLATDKEDTARLSLREGLGGHMVAGRAEFEEGDSTVSTSTPLEVPSVTLPHGAAGASTVSCDAHFRGISENVDENDDDHVSREEVKGVRVRKYRSGGEGGGAGACEDGTSGSGGTESEGNGRDSSIHSAAVVTLVSLSGVHKCSSTAAPTGNNSCRSTNVGGSNSSGSGEESHDNIRCIKTNVTSGAMRASNASTADAEGGSQQPLPAPNKGVSSRTIKVDEAEQARVTAAASAEVTSNHGPEGDTSIGAKSPDDGDSPRETREGDRRPMSSLPSSAEAGTTTAAVYSPMTYKEGQSPARSPISQPGSPSPRELSAVCVDKQTGPALGDADMGTSPARKQTPSENAWREVSRAVGVVKVEGSLGEPPPPPPTAAVAAMMTTTMTRTATATGTITTTIPTSLRGDRVRDARDFQDGRIQAPPRYGGDAPEGAGEKGSVEGRTTESRNDFDRDDADDEDAVTRETDRDQSSVEGYLATTRRIENYVGRMASPTITSGKVETPPARDDGAVQPMTELGCRPVIPGVPGVMMDGVSPPSRSEYLVQVSAKDSGESVLSFNKSAPPRRGKWSRLEEQFAKRIIADFDDGVLDAPPGVGLRQLLASKLRCEVMRVSKKFCGWACVGKRSFRPVRYDDGRATRAQASLRVLEQRWLKSFVSSTRCPEQNAENVISSSPSIPSTPAGGSAFLPKSIMRLVPAPPSVKRDDGLAGFKTVTTPAQTWLHRAKKALAHDTPVGAIDSLVEEGQRYCSRIESTGGEDGRRQGLDVQESRVRARGSLCPSRRAHTTDGDQEPRRAALSAARVSYGRGMSSSAAGAIELNWIDDGPLRWRMSESGHGIGDRTFWKSQRPQDKQRTQPSHRGREERGESHPPVDHHGGTMTRRSYAQVPSPSPSSSSPPTPRHMTALHSTSEAAGEGARRFVVASASPPKLVLHGSCRKTPMHERPRRDEIHAGEHDGTRRTAAAETCSPWQRPHTGGRHGDSGGSDDSTAVGTEPLYPIYSKRREDGWDTAGEASALPTDRTSVADGTRERSEDHRTVARLLQPSSPMCVSAIPRRPSSPCTISRRVAEGATKDHSGTHGGGHSVGVGGIKGYMHHQRRQRCAREEKSKAEEGDDGRRTDDRGCNVEYDSVRAARCHDRTSRQSSPFTASTAHRNRNMRNVGARRSAGPFRLKPPNQLPLYLRVENHREVFYPGNSQAERMVADGDRTHERTSHAVVPQQLPPPLPRTGRLASPQPNERSARPEKREFTSMDGQEWGAKRDGPPVKARRVSATFSHNCDFDDDDNSSGSGDFGRTHGKNPQYWRCGQERSPSRGSDLRPPVANSGLHPRAQAGHINKVKREGTSHERFFGRESVRSGGWAGNGSGGTDVYQAIGNATTHVTAPTTSARGNRRFRVIPSSPCYSVGRTEESSGTAVLVPSSMGVVVPSGRHAVVSVEAPRRGPG